LYNWIKFKTLPPSVLFKNRLYIERDSKTRRITSNLGLTFRNSKWTNYARTDINLNLKTQFFTSLYTIFLVTLFLFILINGLSFYNTNLLNNELIFVLWYIKDFCLYSIFSLLTLSTFLLTSLFEKSYTFFSGWIFTKKISLVKSSPESELRIPSNQYKYVYYNWLLNVNSSWDNSHYKLFPSLTNLKNDSNYLTTLFQINNYLTRLDKFSVSKNLVSVSSDFEVLNSNFNLIHGQKNII
jgi:hypothetical protein